MRLKQKGAVPTATNTTTTTLRIVKHYRYKYNEMTGEKRSGCL